jgi:hypothetical protein
MLALSKRISLPTLALALCTILLASSALAVAPSYVIEISVDGLGSTYLQNLVNNSRVPNMSRLLAQGASTFNARNDFDSTETLQNHVSMMTARGVFEGNYTAQTTTGHFWDVNGELGSTTIAAKRANRYVASVFDVAHDNGLSTGLFATKSKFNLFNTSYNNNNGAPDTTGPDNGRNKIDNVVATDYDSTTMMSAYTAAMTGDSPLNYSFVHFYEPDSAGHSSGWGSAAYNAAVTTVDGYLGTILSWVDNPASLLHNKTTIIFTADHGGSGTNHGVAFFPLNYTIPFVAWGAGVAAGDLYAMNNGIRWDPNTAQILYSAANRPIRNSDGANLALDLLGLGAIPGSTINADQSLLVPEPSSILLLLIAASAILVCWRRR